LVGTCELAERGLPRMAAFRAIGTRGRSRYGRDELVHCLALGEIGAVKPERLGHGAAEVERDGAGWLLALGQQVARMRTLVLVELLLCTLDT
jgi:hypothetical protein